MDWRSIDLGSGRLWANEFHSSGPSRNLAPGYHGIQQVPIRLSHSILIIISFLFVLFSNLYYSKIIFLFNVLGPSRQTPISPSIAIGCTFFPIQFPVFYPFTLARGLVFESWTFVIFYKAGSLALWLTPNLEGQSTPTN